MGETGTYVGGKRSGKYKKYFSTGELQVEGKYKNGEKHGVWKEYNKKGKVVKKEKYDKGGLIYRKGS